MRLFLFVMCIALGVSAVSAGTIVIKPELLPDTAYDVPVTMPCNWDRNVINVRVYGFYGENGNKDRLEMVGLRSEGETLHIKFPQDTMNGPQGEELQRVEVEFPQTQRHCTEGFGFMNNPLVR